MIRKIYNYIIEKKMLDNCRHIIVGLSGGADSVCLTTVLHEIIEQNHMDITLSAVHVNHGIRGEEAARDQRFCVKLCKQLAIECYVFNEDVPKIADERKISLETAGRQVRYECFAQIKNTRKASAENIKIAVAHHQNDLVETCLMHLIRGSGIEGLCGILPVNGDIIRPLLCVNKKEIISYLEQKGCNYVVDSSNMENEYQRNQLRNQFIPMIESTYNPEFSKAVYNLAADLEEINVYIKKQVAELEKKCVVYYTTSNEMQAKITINFFEKADRMLQTYLLREVLKKMADRSVDIYRKHIQMLQQLCKKQTGKRIYLSNALIAVRTSYEMIIMKPTCALQKIDEQKAAELHKKDWETMHIHWNEIQKGNEQHIDLDIPFCDCYGVWHKAIKLSLEVLPKKSMQHFYFDNDYTKFFDCDKIKNTFDIRFRQQGDFIRMDTQGHKKKLKKEFIDLKVPIEARDHVLLLADESEILWAVGVRRCQTALIDELTKNVLKISVIVENKG